MADGVCDDQGNVVDCDREPGHPAVHYDRANRIYWWREERLDDLVEAGAEALAGMHRFTTDEEDERDARAVLAALFGREPSDG